MRSRRFSPNSGEEPGGPRENGESPVFGGGSTAREGVRSEHASDIDLDVESAPRPRADLPARRGRLGTPGAEWRLRRRVLAPAGGSRAARRARYRVAGDLS